MSVDGVVLEQNTNFAGKDGFYWWIGEVEDNQDPLTLGRVKVRVLNYYTNPAGGSADNLPTDDLPWATVLQGTDQAGNDGQGESSGQLQPGAICMGFFMDGESAQIPVVMGVIRINKGGASGPDGGPSKFLFTGKEVPPGIAPNAATSLPTDVNESGSFQQGNNSVALPGTDAAGQTAPPAKTGPKSMGTQVAGSVTGNPQKPATPEPDAPIPAASGTGGPWKTFEYQLKYLIQDLIDTASNLVKAEKGEFLNVVENKIVTVQQLMSKIRNFLSALFAQVVAAIRAQLDELVQKIEAAFSVTDFLGVPGLTFALIQQAVNAILSVICGIDSQIISFINAPIEFLLNIVNGFLDGAITAAEAAIQSVEAMIDQITCGVQSILSQALKVIDTVSKIVSGVGKAKEIIDTWKQGSQIFNAKFDISKLSAKDLVGILILLLSLFPFGCNRKSTGGEDTVGWFPFFGTTSCTPEALAQIPIGSGKRSCGGGSTGGFLDSFFEEADPYLTAAKTFINGAYTMQMGTPGRQATIVRTASGTTHTSIKSNNDALTQHKAEKAIQADAKGKELSETEKQKRIDAYKKKNKVKGGEEGNLTADHISYGGNLTQTIPSDDCKDVGGDYVRTISGDYRLKITGDCHLEIGGALLLNAQGGPKQVDSKGKDAKDKDKIQKHSVTFGSDLDLNVSGANLKMQATQVEFTGRDIKIGGSSFLNSCKVSTHSCGEFVVNAGNAITMNTTTMVQNVNFLPPKPGLGSYLVQVGGPITFTQIPGGATKIPPFVVTTPGPFTVSCAAGGAAFNVAAGAFSVAVAAGAVSLKASAAVTAEAGGGMTLTAGATMILTAPTIKLN